jgi:pyruvate,water dikinase
VLTRNVDVPEAERKQYCISDDEVLQLANFAVTIEEHYSQKRGKHVPMDIEWAKDGETGELFIVQARPETVQSLKRKDVLETYYLDGTSDIIVTGRSVGAKIATGKVHVIPDVSQLNEFNTGEILVADTTTPDWEPVMKRAAAIITNKGGRTCHAAIVSRELGIPAVVGAENATEILENGMDVTVSCAEGDAGRVYEGTLSFHTEIVELEGIEKTKTEIMMNLGNPEEAFALSMIPNDGIGLARLEFIITSYIKVHPMALIHPEKVEDEEVLEEIDKLTGRYENKADFFVGKLAQGVGTIAAAFHPKPVVVRMSDFKSNEYESLIGGEYFEFEENNPMLGFRGASRYYDKRYLEGFALECKAMKKVRDEMGLTNLILMIPFCRRIEEAEKVLEEMKKNGLVRGENGLQVYMMTEIPSNVLLIDEFSQYFDGFSIGSNDLTQLTLGVDRDSEILASSFDERDEAVKKIVSMAVQGAKRNNKHSGLCGQAPSDFPEFAEFLVKEGIDSISLNPDSVMKIGVKVLEVEKRMEKSK